MTMTGAGKLGSRRQSPAIIATTVITVTIATKGHARAGIHAGVEELS